MSELSFLWDGTVTGDAGPYDQDDYSDMLGEILSASSMADGNRSGVVDSKNLTGNLGVSGVATPVTIQEGAAIVDGTMYYNNADVTVAIPAPAADTRIDYIVLRKSWAAQTIRITRIAGVEGAGAPALTQTIGTIWDFPLAQASIAVGGVITVTDVRVFLNRVVDYRQGSSATDWSLGVLAGGAPFINDYRPRNPLIQCGTMQWTGSAHEGGLNIVYPTPFKYSPLVIISVGEINQTAGTHGTIATYLTLQDETGFSMHWIDNDAANNVFDEVSINWIAIGERV